MAFQLSFYQDKIKRTVFGKYSVISYIAITVKLITNFLHGAENYRSRL